MTAQSLTRRSLLSLIGYGAALGGIGGPGWAASAEPGPFVLLLTDLPAELSERLLMALLTPLAKDFLRVGIELPTPKPSMLSPVLQEALMRVEAQRPGLVERIPLVPPPSRRAELSYVLAHELADAMADTMAAGREMFAASSLPVTLCVQPGGPQGADWAGGARVLGFRTVFESEASSAPTTIGTPNEAVWHVRGGLHWHWQDGPEQWEADFSTALAEDVAVVARLSLAGVQDQDTETVADLARALAAMLTTHKQAGDLISLLPRELSFRALGKDYGQSVLLLVEEGGDRTTKGHLAAFQALIAQAGLPLEVLSRRSNDSFAITGCSVSVADMPDFSSCLAQPEGAAAGAASLVVRGPEEAIGFGGPDDAGTLIVPLVADIADAASGADRLDRLATNQASLRDSVVLVRQSALTTPSARTLLANAIKRLGNNGRARFRTELDFSTALFPEFPLLDLLHRTEAAQAWPDLAPGALPSLEGEALLTDAATAFAFFMSDPDPNTGLSAPTEFHSDSFSTRYETITMWDVASNLFAVLSAMELGLLEQAEGEAWVEKIVAAIPTRTVKGLSLPIAEFEYRLRDTSNRAFNASDVGRLLIALRAAADRTPSREAIETMVSGWDLPATVVDGIPMNVFRGQYVNAGENHYLTYLRRGYALWGVDMAPAFVPDMADDAFTGQMRIMRTAKQYGLLGAEPHGLEAIELGTSTTTQLLSDVLIAAQYETFRATGELVAVTETPLDREPWFTYQGLDLERPAYGWKVRPNPPDWRYDSPEMQAALKVFSAKAAYLAAAMHPSVFSDKLLAAARAHCAVPEKSFCVGTYAASGAPMSGYSDINTNGVILEVLAFLARGRTPMIG